MNWCILIPIIVGIISAILGYLLGKVLLPMYNKDNDSDDDNDYSTKISSLEADLASCKNNASQLKTELDTYKSKSATAPSFNIETSRLETDLTLSKARVSQLEAELLSLKSTGNSTAANDELADYKTKLSKAESDLALSKSRTTVLENDLESCKKSKVDLEKQLDNLTNATTSNKQPVAKVLPTEEKLAQPIKKEEPKQVVKKPAENKNANTGSVSSSETPERVASVETDKTEILPPKKAEVNKGTDVTKTLFGKAITQDDFTIIEGIGPRTQRLFHNFNIKTWEALSNCDIDKCKEVLKSGGKRFEMHDPSTWPKQAQLAYEGKWQELYDWQNKLK